MRVTRNEENLEPCPGTEALKRFLLLLRYGQSGAKSYRVFLFTLQTHPLELQVIFQVQAALALELYS